VIKDGFLYGLSAGNEFFCLNTQDGKTVWTAPFGPAAAAAAPATGGGQGGGERGGRGGRGMGGGMRGGGYGSIVDAGSVLLALTPAGQLVAFKPGGESFTEVARIKVAESSTYAYPVVSGQRLFIKDQDSLTLFTVESP
jgi:outer membrane protein assembly factor BamB